MILEHNGFTDCNQKAAEMLGRTCEELLGLQPWEISPSRQADGQTSRKKALVLIKQAASEKSTVYEWTKHITFDPGTAGIDR